MEIEVGEINCYLDLIKRDRLEPPYIIYVLPYR